MHKKKRVERMIRKQEEFEKRKRGGCEMKRAR